MFHEWVSRSLRRRLLVSLLLGVGLSLAAFQLVVDQIVDRYVISSFATAANAAGQRDRLLHEIDVILLAGVVTVLAVSAFITIVSVRRGLKPLEAATAAARAISPEHPARALPLAGLPAEIRPLGERINELLEGLADSLERERRFSADLAHELRTPLAEIRALAEVSADARHVFVRGDITFLRQDFSVPQKVPSHGVWPERQRFDFMVRLTPVPAGLDKFQPRDFWKNTKFATSKSPDLREHFMDAALLTLPREKPVTASRGPGVRSWVKAIKLEPR